MACRRVRKTFSISCVRGVLYRILGNVSSKFATFHLVLADRRATSGQRPVDHAASRQKKGILCRILFKLVILRECAEQNLLQGEHVRVQGVNVIGQVL